MIITGISKTWSQMNSNEKKGQASSSNQIINDSDKNML